MQIAYVDETYNEAVYSFVAFLVHEERDAAMQRKILAIPGRFASHGIDPNAELHGSDLFHSRRAWKTLRDQPGLRVHAYQLGLRVVGTFDGKLAFVSTRRTGEAAHSLSAARLATLDLLLTCLEKEGERFDERCLLIFDEAGSANSALVKAVHAHHRRELTKGPTPRVVEAPGIAHSHRTPGIQIADLAAFLFQRRRQGRDGKETASGQALGSLWKTLEPSVICEIGP